MMRALWAVPVAAGLCLTPSVAFATEPPVMVDESLVYLYQKLDHGLPAAWENSGRQDLFIQEPGTEFAVLGVLPAWVCGPGWGAQFDVIQHNGSFIVPLTVEYPEAVFSDAGVLVKAKHVDLVTPDCVPEPTPVPTPVPTPETPAKPLLAATGVNVAPFAIGGLVVALAGVVLKVAGRRKKVTS